MERESNLREKRMLQGGERRGFSGKRKDTDGRGIGRSRDVAIEKIYQIKNRHGGGCKKTKGDKDRETSGICINSADLEKNLKCEIRNAAAEQRDDDDTKDIGLTKVDEPPTRDIPRQIRDRSKQLLSASMKDQQQLAANMLPEHAPSVACEPSMSTTPTTRVRPNSHCTLPRIVQPVGRSGRRDSGKSGGDSGREVRHGTREGSDGGKEGRGSGKLGRYSNREERDGRGKEGRDGGREGRYGCTGVRAEGREIRDGGREGRGDGDRECDEKRDLYTSGSESSDFDNSCSSVDSSDSGDLGDSSECGSDESSASSHQVLSRADSDHVGYGVRRSLATTRLHTRSRRREEEVKVVEDEVEDNEEEVDEEAEGKEYDLLLPSLFPHVPPTIHFPPEGSRNRCPKRNVKRLLKWRLMYITPQVVRAAVQRAGFTLLARTNTHSWLGSWGNQMRPDLYTGLRYFQKFNHFPTSFVLGRKDRLWHLLRGMQIKHGTDEFDFVPKTFILPADLPFLRMEWKEGGQAASKQRYIVKPPASCRGLGIFVASKWSQLPRGRSCLVQRYISNPYLINSSKFDLRLYVYVSCTNPLRIYLYQEGLVRFASCEYNNLERELGNRFIHLTNYSINSKNIKYRPCHSEEAAGALQDETRPHNHKWRLTMLWQYLMARGVDVKPVWEEMKEIVVKTFVAAESHLCQGMAGVGSRYSCHELFGFDILLDANLKPWLLEVNISPSLHTASPLDKVVKDALISDLFNLAGYRLPHPKTMTPTGRPSGPLTPARRISQVSVSRRTSREMYMDKKMYDRSQQQLADDERQKHIYYSQRSLSDAERKSVLHVLTPDDVRMLVETEDEYNRRGAFKRLYPSLVCGKYREYWERPRYYNVLLEQWTREYCLSDAQQLLLQQCQQKYHLLYNHSDTRECWTPTSATTNFSQL